MNAKIKHPLEALSGHEELVECSYELVLIQKLGNKRVMRRALDQATAPGPP
jgi:hypothetical protein